jgi:hypothetical protein
LNFTDWAGITGQRAWANARSGPGFIPAWLRVSPAGAGVVGDVVPGDIVMHSQDNQNGAGLGQANVVWQSQAFGRIDIRGGIWITQDIGRGNDWTIELNGQLCAAGRVESGDPFSRANPQRFVDNQVGLGLTNLAVTPGDRVVLTVVRTTNDGMFAGVDLIVDLRP